MNSQPSAIFYTLKFDLYLAKMKYTHYQCLTEKQKNSRRATRANLIYLEDEAPYEVEKVLFTQQGTVIVITAALTCSDSVWKWRKMPSHAAPTEANVLLYEDEEEDDEQSQDDGLSDEDSDGSDSQIDIEEKVRALK